MKQRWERVLGDVLEGVEEEWRRFKETILEVGEEGFGTKRIKQGMRRKGSAWRSEEIRRIVRKKECFSIWRRSRSEEDLEEYRKMKRVVKRMVREARKRVNEEWTLSIAENFKENKKTFWKGVNEVRGRVWGNSKGEELIRENDTEGRWKEYFIQLLNGDEVRDVGDVRRESS